MVDTCALLLRRKIRDVKFNWHVSVDKCGLGSLSGWRFWTLGTGNSLSFLVSLIYYLLRVNIEGHGREDNLSKIVAR